MKKALSLLLVFVMLLSLCACGKDDAQNTDPSTTPSQGTTEGTGKPTDSTEGTTGTTQAPTDEPTAAPTDEPTTPTTTCSHSYKDATCTAPKTCSKCGATEGNAAGHSWNAATCAAPKTCSTCGATEGSVGGHNYQNGVCTGCGDVEVITHPIEAGAGYAISLSSDGKQLNCYQIGSEGLLYTTYDTQKPAEGYYNFRVYNGTTYYTPAPSWGQYSIASSTISGRTVQLELYEETLELELISANQYKVTKGVEHIPEGLVFTFGTDSCSHMGHYSSVQCEGDVTCWACDQFMCTGFGHEYGEDDVCFRCFAVMRPSD